MNLINYPKCGDVFFASLPMEGNVQGGVRPVVVIQNDIGNKHSPIVNIIPMSSKVDKAKYLPIHVVIPADATNGLKMDSVVLTEQTRIIQRDQLLSRIGFLRNTDLARIKRAWDIQFPFRAS